MSDASADSLKPQHGEPEPSDASSEDRQSDQQLTPEFEAALARAVAAQRAHDLGVEPLVDDSDEALLAKVEEVARLAERMPTLEEMAEGIAEIAAGRKPSNIKFAEGGILNSRRKPGLP